MSGDCILAVDHLTHALRRPRRRQRAVVRRRAAQDHRADRPERRRQDHGVQLHHRLLQADRRHDAARRMPTAAHPARAAERFPDRQTGQGRAHLPEHPAVSRHDRAGKLDGGAAQRADARLGPHLSRADRRCRPVAPPRRAPIDRRAAGSSASGCSSAPTMPPAICPMASSGGSKSRAPCAPSRSCSAWTSPPPD